MRLSAKRHGQLQPAKGDKIAAGGRGAMQHVTVTVVPQLPYAESSRSCKDFISANLQASVQKEVMLQQGEGVKQGPAFKRVRTCYISFGVERKRVGAACANVLFEGLAAGATLE